jgi:hypothetical protein
MLKAVGTSYAMANAHPDVLRTARGRTASNDEGGVAQALERFVRRVAWDKMRCAVNRMGRPPIRTRLRKASAQEDHYSA